MPEFYEIRVKGHLDPYWSDWFASLEVTPLDGEETLFSGYLPDQAALHGLIKRIRDFNLTLVSVMAKTPPSTDDCKGDFNDED
jgi:hypothetical protein